MMTMMMMMTMTKLKESKAIMITMLMKLKRRGNLGNHKKNKNVFSQLEKNPKMNRLY